MDGGINLEFGTCTVSRRHGEYTSEDIQEFDVQVQVGAKSLRWREEEEGRRGGRGRKRAEQSAGTEKLRLR